MIIRKRLVLLIISVIVSVALFVLTLATGQTHKLFRYFYWILAFNGLVILVLFLALLKRIIDLFFNKRKKIFGANITIRLVSMFGLVAIIPISLLFMVAYQFINKSIDTWFNADTEKVLERGLRISRSLLYSELNNAIKEAIELHLSMQYMLSLNTSLKDILNNLDEHNLVFDQLAIVDMVTGDIIATKVNGFKLRGKMNDNSTLLITNIWPKLNIFQYKELILKSIIGENIFVLDKLYSQIWIKLPIINGKQYAVFFRKQIPEQFNNEINLIEESRDKYVQFTLMKDRLKFFFILTLIIVAMSSILLSLLIAMYLSRKFILPLLSLAKITNSISEGDYTQKIPISKYGKDELSTLSSSFNKMTEQLLLAKNETEKLYNIQEQDRLYLKSILSNLKTGVISIDENGYFITYNLSAVKISNINFKNYTGKKWNLLYSAGSVEVNFAEFIKVLIDNHMSKPIEYEFKMYNNKKLLLGKASRLNFGKGYVLVFDDITTLVSAQQEAAWGEVARRFAHEIKNPLTPIQLSAERLAFKLNDKLNDNDAEFLKKSTNVIINQVSALKDMVESFRNYAKSASLKLELIDFNNIVKEVIILYEGTNCRIKENLTSKELLVMVDINSIRQVIHNIFKNAVEAALECENPIVEIKTFLEDKNAVLIVINNGKSFSSEILSNIFKPYITDKINGTGLGLMVVKKIIDEHSGEIILGNNANLNGAWVKIALKLKREL